ncbi:MULTISPECIES: hypothetical protein [unclassified Microbacterium]|uniref:hypothetical protein n=1 Tax=unclassified Microbacterium TaxID=2609290 RepID=UPI000EA8BDDF|nr:MULTISPECIES: hypothetical protein [unclassified Microbacterium]MBT2485734.1 hypothetical protein [Microbacterium sp. ISL-108]RKN68502.1 hypothetical protein D7252_13525 [Microbacterium sp. CGR2]
MTDTRNHAKIAASLRRRAQAAETQLTRLRSAIAEQNRMLLGIVLRDVLADPADFARFVDVDRLYGADGALIWADVWTQLEQLLAARPYLAAPQSDDPRPRGRRALSLFSTGA